MKTNNNKLLVLAVALLALLIQSCATNTSATNTGAIANSDDPAESSGRTSNGYQYLIGSGDSLGVFVWRNPDLSVERVTVRPDGYISTPLVGDVEASGKSPKALARDVEKILSQYIKNPYVTVTVLEFVSRYEAQIRIVGEAASPQFLPFREHMTLLDVMIAVGGLSEFAAGNSAKIIRKRGRRTIEIKVRIKSLLKDGDISANVPMRPGDIIIIPESWF